MKRLIKNMVIGIPRLMHISSAVIGSPRGSISIKEWCKKNDNHIIELTASTQKTETPPIPLNEKTRKIFTTEFSRKTPDLFVATIPQGRVWSSNGVVITSDDFVIREVSREFGKYKGHNDEQLSIFRRLYLGKIRFYRGNVAVITTAGCNNYYHWMIDVLPRINLLKKAGLFEQVDRFIIDYSGLPFQKESLQQLGITEEKIINANRRWYFHVRAEFLIVPSLASELSSVDSWQCDFLKNIFIEKNSYLSNKESILPERIFISRKKAETRKLLNEDEIVHFLAKHGYTPICLEDYSIKEVSKIMNNAKNIIAMHGAGNTNWVFCSDGVKYTELFLTTQVFPNYWFIANCRKGTYQYIVSEGKSLSDDDDPVLQKQNEDFTITIENLQKAL